MSMDDGGFSSHMAFFSAASGSAGYTVSTERMRITANGSVGIGTATPANLLTVSQLGANYSSPVLVIDAGIPGNTSAGAPRGIGRPLLGIGNSSWTGGGVAGDYYGIGFGYGGATSGTSGYYYPAEIGLYVQTTSGNTYGDLVFSTRPTTTATTIASERMRITSAGNIGIGTASPAGRLSVLLDGTGVGNIGSWGVGHAVFGPGAGSTSGSGLGITYNTAGNYSAIISLTPGIAWRDMYYYANSHNFYYGASALMTILSSGYVGIGTTLPTNPLQVAGRSIFGYIPGSRTGMFIDNETSYGTTPCIQGVSTAFGTNPISINPAGGNVGIGTVNPGYSLDVAGITRSAGVINTVPAHYIGYTSSNPTIYQTNGTNNTSGTLYNGVYNYVTFPTNIQTPAGFITAVGGKYTLAYSGIYTITFTTHTAASNNQPLETFISKNGYNSTDLNVPGTVMIASSYHPASTAQWCFSWTGYLSSSEFFCVGFFTGATSGYLSSRTTLSVALVNRTG
jgi:hypothetical protein